MARFEQIIEFWFAGTDPDGPVDPGHERRWFGVDQAFDREVRGHFESDLRTAAAGRRVRWEESARGSLAVILLFDQFPRNMYRGTPRAYMFDQHALRCLDRALARGLDRELAPLHRAFLYMPLQHAEDLERQEAGCRLFAGLVDEAPASQAELLAGFRRSAHEHREVIQTFGRFPHRNEVLGRESTASERAFLARGGTGWGQRGE